MSLIENLRRLDRKERFAVLREAMGFDQKAPRLGTHFRKKLEECIHVEVPKRAFLAMDYHLDWIELALYMAQHPDIRNGSLFKNPNRGAINKNQQDVDLLVAFEAESTSGTVTHLVLAEAKAYLPWQDSQLKSKTRRLGEIFGRDGRRHRAVKPHFVLMTNSVPTGIKTESWPDWTKTGAKRRLEYDLPPRLKATRRSESGKPSKGGDYLSLRYTGTASV